MRKTSDTEKIIKTLIVQGLDEEQINELGKEQSGYLTNLQKRVNKKVIG